MQKPNGTQLYRIEQLEKNYASLNSKMQRLLENDIPHLHENINSLKVRVTLLTSLNIGALLLVALLAYLLKV